MPEGLASIRRSTQVDFERFRCAPAAPGMVIKSKVMSRWYAIASAYRPTKWYHDQGSAFVRRLYKRWCGISCYANVEVLFVPQVDSGMGLMDARTHWVMGVHREWIRNFYQALDHFGTSQEEYLRYIHQR